MSISISKKQVETAIDAITCGFDWEYTEEGYEYWRDVHNALVRLSAKADGNRPVELSELITHTRGR